MEQQQSLTLRDGDRLPIVGLGTWKIDKAQVPGLLGDAVSAGYRHLDCACDYGNEAEVGEGLAKVFDSGVCRREEVWVTSKLWNTYHAPADVRAAAERSLRDLRLDYLDLYLIHFPISLKYVPFDERYPPGWIHDPDADRPKMEFAPVPIQETWGAMERLVQAGLVKHIGVCNFNTALLRDMLAYAAIPPACLQIELHPYLTQAKLVRFCHEQGIAVTAFSPLGAGSYLELEMAKEEESVLREPLIRQLADAYSRTPAQIVLRWAVQRGTAVIPKTTRGDRLRENIAIFNFRLTDDEMASISRLNRDRRFNDPGEFCERAFGAFCPIYE